MLKITNPRKLFVAIPLSDIIEWACVAMIIKAPKTTNDMTVPKYACLAIIGA
jgi:hypothetical protein